MNWIELAIYITTSVLIAVLIFLIVVLFLKNKKLFAQSVQSEVDKLIMVSQIEKLINEKENSNVENTDGFIKFISDSRDWAFTYIEDVQQALMVYDVALSTDDAKIINEAYKKLMSFLPEDNVVS